MKSIAMAILAAASLVAAGATYAQDEKSAGCVNCHKGDKDLKALMSKHKGKPDQIQAAVTKVSSGKGHVPVKAKPEEVKAIVEAAAK